MLRADRVLHGQRVVLAAAKREVTELTAVRLHCDAERFIKQLTAGVAVAWTVTLLTRNQIAI